MISTSFFESCNFILFQCDLTSFYFHCSSKSSFFSSFHCKTLLSFNTDFLRKRFTCGKDHTIIQMVKFGKVEVLNIKKCLANGYYTVSGFPFPFLSVLGEVVTINGFCYLLLLAEGMSQLVDC